MTNDDYDDGDDDGDDDGIFFKSLKDRSWTNWVIRIP